jgi:hypothetical protein
MASLSERVHTASGKSLEDRKAGWDGSSTIAILPYTFL